MGEHEIADCVRALDGEVVAVEVGERPGVFGRDEGAGFLVCPELLSLVLEHDSRETWKRQTYDILIILMQVYTRLLTRLPLLWYRAIDVRLMYNLRYQLCLLVDHVRARRGDLGAVDGICGAGDEEEGDECAEGVEEEADDDQVDDQEDDRAAAHGEKVAGYIRGRLEK